jgi:cellulose synthase/poly-beta-1,6-N-acetylglucosamine synthase-like glycosyltransferase
MELAQGDIFVFTDDDIRPSHDWLEHLCNPILSEAADAVAGAIAIAPSRRRSWMEPLHCALLASTDGWDARNPDAMNGANMAFSRRVLAKVPGFDPELGPGALGFWDEA